MTQHDGGSARERVIMAGFGGQGMMLLGKVYATAAMEAGFQVTFFPSYGAEVRGGTAHCNVILSDRPIYSPMVETADTIIVMNQPSYDKFRPRLRPDGLVLLNTSMAQRDDAQENASEADLVGLPASEIADNLGNVRVANTIMLGAYLCLRPILKADDVFAVFAQGMTGPKAALLEINRRAFTKGMDLAAQFRRVPA